MGRTILSIGALCTVYAMPLSAEEPRRLEPSSQWMVDYGDTKCRLSRTFGEGEDRHVLFFEQWGPASRFGFTASGPGFDRFRAHRSVWVTFFDSEKLWRTEPFVGDLGSFGSAVIYPSLGLSESNKSGSKDRVLPFAELDVERAKTVSSLTIKQGSRRVDFAIDGLGDAFLVLNNCAQSMINVWGLDLDQHKTATRRPVWTNQGKVVRAIKSTYPTSALRMGEQGITWMRVMIDEDGTVSDCVINKATVTEELESPACKAMRKAVFEPALDDEGKPMRSFYFTSISYRVSG